MAPVAQDTCFAVRLSRATATAWSLHLPLQPAVDPAPMALGACVGYTRPDPSRGHAAVCSFDRHGVRMLAIHDDRAE